MTGIINPPSTAPTTTFTGVQITNAATNVITTFAGSTLVTNTVPAPATGVSLAQADKTLTASTTYTITYTVINQHPVGSYFKVVIPSTISVGSTLSTCSI
jgi:hypothetical protein